MMVGISVTEMLQSRCTGVAKQRANAPRDSPPHALGPGDFQPQHPEAH